MEEEKRVEDRKEGDFIPRRPSVEPLPLPQDAHLASDHLPPSCGLIDSPWRLFWGDPWIGEWVQCNQRWSTLSEAGSDDSTAHIADSPSSPQATAIIPLLWLITPLKRQLLFHGGLGGQPSPTPRTLIFLAARSPVEPFRVPILPLRHKYTASTLNRQFQFGPRQQSWRLAQSLGHGMVAVRPNE